MVCIMSGEENCSDNAYADLLQYKQVRNALSQYKTLEEAYRDIFWYIEILFYCNRRRKHQPPGVSYSCRV